MNNKLIYLDNNASTPIDPEVIEIMHKIMKTCPYNPSSAHKLGQKAKLLLLNAKRRIAKIINVLPDEIIFTSSATESLNFLIKGFVKFYNNPHIISSKIEHSATLKTLEYLEKKENANISYVYPSINGQISYDSISKSIKEDTKLIILSSVNSETGIINDIANISKLCKEKDISLIVDGVGEFGKNVLKYNINDLAGFVCSSHKIHGPKGIAIAYLNKKYIKKFPSFIHGGYQESELRGGTENLPAICGFAKAIEIGYKDLEKNISYIKSLRDTFEKKFSQKIPIKINGNENRICNVSNISFTNIDAEDLLIHLNENNIIASHGSACNSNSAVLSHVLLNMGYPIDRVKSSIRFSFSKKNTFTEILTAIDSIYLILK